MLNNSNTVDCIAVICQEPKSSSLFLCVRTDEAGKEEGKLQHQRWHCEYLMPFTGEATDQSQKLCSPVTAKTHPGQKKEWPVFD